MNCRERVEIPDPEVASLSLVTLDHRADGHCLIDAGHHPDITISTWIQTVATMATSLDFFTLLVFKDGKWKTIISMVQMYDELIILFRECDNH